MVTYNWMTEAWEDEETSKSVSMTPEGDQEELNQSFKNWQEFYKWYYGT